MKLNESDRLKDLIARAWDKADELDGENGHRFHDALLEGLEGACDDYCEDIAYDEVDAELKPVYMAGLGLAMKAAEEGKDVQLASPEERNKTFFFLGSEEEAVATVWRVIRQVELPLEP